MHLNALNERVAALAERGRLRTARLADGELVIRLRGAETNVAHAGLWGGSAWYLLVERRRLGGAAQMLSGLGLRVTTNDAGVLALGDEAALLRVFDRGPAWSRPRRRRPAGSAEHLAAFRMSAYMASSEAIRAKSPAGRSSAYAEKEGRAKPPS
jgi:hypothetical protein